VGAIKMNLYDEEDRLVTSVEVERDEPYLVNDYFRAADGGLYLVSEVSPDSAEVSAIWIDGPHPTQAS
jgi:hypothetical protein